MGVAGPGNEVPGPVGANRLKSVPAAEAGHAQVARDLGALFVRARTAQGKSQEIVASEAGIDVKTYSQIERGYSARETAVNPTLRTLVRIWTVLKLEPFQMPQAPEASP